jgi:hypothetical protein
MDRLSTNRFKAVLISQSDAIEHEFWKHIYKTHPTLEIDIDDCDGEQLATFLRLVMNAMTE